MQQQVIAEQVKVQQIEKEQQIKVQEAEILRHEKELIATVLKRRGDRAAADREACWRLRRSRLTTEAEGRAAAIRAQGEAEAAVIFQKGEAEAKAMNVKAEAYQEWTQAAVVDRLITNMAEVVRAMAEPLSKVDKITIVSTGNDGRGREQADGRHHEDCGAGAGSLRGALRHGYARADVERKSHARDGGMECDDRRQGMTTRAEAPAGS